MSQEFRLPDLGEGITEAQIIKVLVEEGATIEEDQSLFEVETDKAAVEIPSPHAGTISRIHTAEGQTVNVGDVLITFGGAAAPTAAPAAARAARAESSASATAVAVAPPPPVAAPPVSARRTTVPAAPSVRKLARERGLDLDTVRGSGPGGRVTREDVEAAAGGGRTAAPAPAATPPPSVPSAPPPGVADADKWGAVRKAPISQIRKTIAQQMMRSVTNIPHVTHIDQIDVTETEAMRRSYNAAYDGKKRVTMMAIVIKAVTQSLRNHPVFNAALDLEAGEIVYKDYMNIGIAVDTERGLVVPNVRGADRLTIAQIAGELGKIAEKARNVQFAIDDLRGGTFTITNVGALGGLFSTPIINYPEVAILGLGKAKPMPLVKDGEITARTVMPMSLSFDHRIADGAQAARFCGEMIGYLENPARLLF